MPELKFGEHFAKGHEQVAPGLQRRDSGVSTAWKLYSSLPCSRMLCQQQEEHYSPTHDQNGQHHCSDICEQGGWNSVSQVEHHSQGTMALVHEPGYYSGGGAFTRSSQYNCRPRILGNEGPVRLDVESQDVESLDLQQDPAEEVLQPGTRSRGGCTSSTASTSRMAYLRQHFQSKEISEEGIELLLASWRQKSSKSYDSEVG